MAVVVVVAVVVAVVVVAVVCLSFCSWPLAQAVRK